MTRRAGNGKQSYPIPIWNGIFEHYDRIGDAIWEFLWCIDKVTVERDGFGIVLGGAPVKLEKVVAELKGSRKETVRKHFKKLVAEKYLVMRRTPYGQVIGVLNSKKFDIWKRKEKPTSPVSPDNTPNPEKREKRASLPPEKREKRAEETRFSRQRNPISVVSKEDSAFNTAINTAETPHLACSVGSRQVHAVEPLQEVETPKNGEATFPLATIEPQIQVSTSSPTRLPPVIAFFKKHGKLPGYIIDETHLLFDGENRFCGYVDRDGKRRDEWNCFESIRMAEQRMSREAIREALQIEIERRVAEAERPVIDQPPPKLTREEKLKMLRVGTGDENVAGRWSARTGVPAHIYLVKNPNERAEEYKRFINRKKQKTPVDPAV
jgi:hypothetical protein